MSGYSVRSIMCRLWLMLMLLNDALIRLVRAVTIEDRSEYQACLASPSTCTNLCAPRPPWKLWCVKPFGVCMMCVCVCTTRLTDVLGGTDF